MGVDPENSSRSSSPAERGPSRGRRGSRGRGGSGRSRSRSSHGRGRGRGRGRGADIQEDEVSVLERQQNEINEGLYEVSLIT